MDGARAGGTAGEDMGDRGRGIATWAAVLALFGGFEAGIGATFVLLAPDGPEYEAATYAVTDETLGFVLAIVNLLIVPLLLAGPVLLLRRRFLGRALVVAGSALSIPIHIAATIPGFAVPVSPITDLWLLVFPVVTLLLALSGETTVWLAGAPSEPERRR